MGSSEPSPFILTLQSKDLPALETHPLSATLLPERSELACLGVNDLPQKPKSLKPQPSTCLKVPSSCRSLLFEEQV